MCITLVAALGFVHHTQTTWQRPGEWSYAIDDTLCSRVDVRDDSMLTFASTTCDDIVSAVRASLDTWSSNVAGKIVFVEVPATPTPSALVVFSIPDTMDGGTVGRALVRSDRAHIELNPDLCWYIDSSACEVMRDSISGITALLMTIFVLSSGIVLVAFAVHSVGRRFQRLPAVRFLLLLGVATPLFIYFGVMKPCIDCYDLKSVVVHEIGHVLGFQHPDVVPDSLQATCGCGANTSITPCSRPYDRSSVMLSVEEARPHACLSNDDIDGLRDVFAKTECDAPRRCHYTKSRASYARMSTAFILAAIVAWSVGFVIDATLWVNRKHHTATRS